MLKFSIIIPCYRDETNLQCLLKQLQRLRSDNCEIIVVDGAGSTACRRICNAFQARWLVSQPCRGQQLYAGAAIAKGDVLWFLHTDLRLSDNAFSAMKQAIEKGAIGGFFRFRFDAPRDWPAGILEPAIAVRCHFGLPYGDQGIFILRDYYFKTGGHAKWPLFEEVPLVKRVRQQGKFVALRQPIFVNPRRWQQDGWWRRTWQNRKLALKFTCGVMPEVLAQHYYARRPQAK